MTKWETKLGVRVEACGIKRMKTKWGSCNNQAGRIWLNLDLVKKPPQCLEYLIVHELIHLIERHHTGRNLADRIARDGTQAGPFENDTSQLEPRTGIGCSRL